MFRFLAFGAALTAAVISASAASAQPAIQVNRSNCQWTATEKFGVDTVTLTVRGICQEPTPGYVLTLSPVALPHADASTLSLALEVAPPTGIEPQHVAATPVEYIHAYVVPFQVAPTKVNIFELAETMGVSAQSSLGH